MSSVSARRGDKEAEENSKRREIKFKVHSRVRRKEKKNGKTIKNGSGEWGVCMCIGAGGTIGCGSMWVQEDPGGTEAESSGRSRV